jgi:hypothetical protein
MGTNYRINGKHVGKTSSRGRGNGYAFMWAMEPREFIRLLREHDNDKLMENTHSNRDDRGETCAVCEAARAILEASSEEFDSIGTGFC